MKNFRFLRTGLVLALVAAIMLSVTGGTIAWFTDTVESSANVIQSGNLDVTLEYYDKADSQFKAVTENTKLFKEGALYEPGYTEVVYLKVANAGNLALKYKLAVNVTNEVAGTNVYGNEFKLSDYLASAAKKIEATEVGTLTREQAMNAAGSTPVATYSTDYIPMEANDNAAYYALVVCMPTTVDNIANHKTGTVAPSLELGVKLIATQYALEEDSFDENYDAAAVYPEDWSGSFETGDIPAEENGIVTISTPEQLAAFAAQVNNGTTYNGKTIKLASDIYLNNQPWTPIGACNSAAYFQGTFDGNGHTIYGLNVDKSADPYEYSTAGFFGWIDAAAATIKNVNFDGATVKGSHWVGVVAGYMTGEISNCTVTNSTVEGNNVNDDANGDKVGGIVGYVNSGAGKLDGNTVKNSTISGNRDVAGLAGAVATTNTVTNNRVENVDIYYGKDYAAEIVSAKTAVVVDSSNTHSNVNLVKGTQVAAGVYETGTSSYTVVSKEGLLNVNTIIAAASTGEGRGIKVKLMADVDLSGENWNPINQMWIDFDGNGHTISNLKTEAWKAGFFGYLGGGSIRNLTLENVDITGAQAGAFAGSIEGTIDNCTLKGTNTITWAEKHQYDDPNSNVEAWNGIGAITGVAAYANVNATIESGTTVTLDKTSFTTDSSCVYVDELTGYGSSNGGNVTNNGTITVIGQ